jgi:hypothetical protein
MYVVGIGPIPPPLLEGLRRLGGPDPGAPGPDAQHTIVQTNI